jgi:uroporphyrinogen-III synthase
MAAKVPVILLKTKSEPTDGYEDYFNVAENGKYAPSFAPVLEHHFRKQSLQEIADLYRTGDLGIAPNQDGSLPKYGGIIFTSQRAVEAFGKVISTLRIYGATNALLPNDIPFYAVGPATARGLRALELDNAIVGEETGNGEALASFILEHYNTLLQSHNRLQNKPRLLFLVGEQRRDIIPTTLQSPQLNEIARIGVDEIVVYETTEMKSFAADFSAKYLRGMIDGCMQQWVVVFSPTGCKAMLDSLGLLDPATGRYRPKPQRPYVAAIGPTTRDFLWESFGFEADVVAGAPSAEGVGRGMEEFAWRQSQPVQLNGNGNGMAVDGGAAGLAGTKRPRTDTL